MHALHTRNTSAVEIPYGNHAPRPDDRRESRGGGERGAGRVLPDGRKLDKQRPSRQIVAMKKSQILRIGSRALAAGSIEDLDLPRIAQEVGFKPSSLRYYYKNREELAEAIFHARIEELEKNATDARSQDSLRGFVGRLFAIELEQYADYLAGRADRKAQIGETRTLSHERRARVGARFNSLVEETGSLMEERGLEAIPGLPRLPAQMLLENLFWLPGWIDRFRQWEFGTVREDLTELFCNGLASDGSEIAGEALASEPESADDSEDAGEKFLRVATQLVCRRGYRGTSIDAISAELGVTKGSFYHHVAEKKDLVERCFDLGYDRISAFQRAASTRHDKPLDAVASVLASIIAAQTGQESPILRYSALPGLPRSIRLTTIAGSDPLDRWFVARLARAQADGTARTVDPYIAAQFAAVVANASYDTVWLYRPSDPDAAGQAILNAILHGFANSV